MKSPSRSQRFVLWFLHHEEQRRRKDRGGRSYVHSMETSAVATISTMRALARHGLVESFEETKRVPKRRGGRGLVRVGFTRFVRVTKWKLTAAGRRLAATLPTPEPKSAREEDSK